MRAKLLTFRKTPRTRTMSPPGRVAGQRRTPGLFRVGDTTTVATTIMTDVVTAATTATTGPAETVVLGVAADSKITTRRIDVEVTGSRTDMDQEVERNNALRGTSKQNSDG